MLGLALKKEGVDIIKQLDTLNVNIIAKKIAQKLYKAFPEHFSSVSELFSQLSRLNMYLAKMKDDLCGAKYYYKNNSIYFNANFSLSEADSFALHECIHYLQEQKDDKGNLIRFGLYDFQKNNGKALNEASVQLMTSYALNATTQTVTYYNLEIPTDSIDCYPLECAIVKQMAYFTGTYPLFHSTIYGNDIFKNTFITLASEEAYNTIEFCLDSMLELEEMLSSCFNELKECGDNIPKINKINTTINKTKEEIIKLFFKCQNTIISHCFSYDLNNIHNVEEIKELKNKIYNFRNYIATNSGYEFYNEFYRRLMEALDEKSEYLEKHSFYELNNETKDLTIFKKSTKIFSTIRNLFVKLGLIKQRGF